MRVDARRMIMAMKDELVYHSTNLMCVVVIINGKAYATLTDKRTGLVTRSPRLGH